MNQPQTKLPLMEDFYTIQGEGQNTGEAAYFIRLGGCDVGCVWCDVKESWDEKKHSLVYPEMIVSRAIKFPSRTAVITGGEPLMYSLDELCDTLIHAGFKTYLETSGAYKLSGTWNWLCVSPKKFKAPLLEILKAADELKIIVFNKSDFNWAEKNASFVKAGCKLFLQPEFSVLEQVIPLIIDYVKDNPQWKISLQTHKIIQVP